MQAINVDSVRAPVKRWEHLTGDDFAKMDRRRTVVVVPSSPLEVHGPHLPVVTDIAEATGLSLRMMELLHKRRPETEFVLMPPLYVASDVLPHAGSVMFQGDTVRRVHEDLGRSLAKQGFRDIWLTSFHGGPRHFVNMEIAAENVNKRYNARMISVFSLLLGLITDGGSELSTFLGAIEGIPDGSLEGDNHAGLVETSMMLFLMGDKVSGDYGDLPRRTPGLKRLAKGLAPIKLGHGSGLKDTLRYFREQLLFYVEDTYSGDPGNASAEVGEEIMEKLATRGTDVFHDVLVGLRRPEDCHSPLWPKRHILNNRLMSHLFEWAIGYKSPIF